MHGQGRQPIVQLACELTYLTRQHRLDDVEQFCGFGEAAGFRKREDRPQLSDVDVDAPVCASTRLGYAELLWHH